MSPRQMRIPKAGRYCNTGSETGIERIRKARALGCDLSYLGIDEQSKIRCINRYYLTK